MLNQPTSSPMMKTIFGFFVDGASWPWATIAVVVALARARKWPLFSPSEQVACPPASPGMLSVSPSARAVRSTRAPTDPAAYPRQAPAAMNSSTEMRNRFIRRTLLVKVAEMSGHGEQRSRPTYFEPSTRTGPAANLLSRSLSNRHVHVDHANRPHNDVSQDFWRRTLLLPALSGSENASRTRWSRGSM